MPQCKAKFCNVKRGQGHTRSKEEQTTLSTEWIHNLGTKNLDIKIYKYSKQNIVCAKHYEEGCFKKE